uniref:Divalent cation transporter n=1 Tax=Strongyloides papillosus TaxID=174720 RepID=A0A0N5B6P6_STREA
MKENNIQHSSLVSNILIDNDNQSVPYIDSYRQSDRSANKPIITNLEGSEEKDELQDAIGYTDSNIFLPETLCTESFSASNIFLENPNDARKDVAETPAQFVTQSCITYIITGLAFVSSGLIFDNQKNGAFLSRYSLGVMLAPALLGLKGNIETTFASRLTTAFHCGKLQKRSAAISYFFGNMALVQIQSVLVSMFIVICASTIGIFFTQGTTLNRHFVEQIFVLMAAAIISTSLCSLFLGFFLFAILKYSKKWEINPDNFLAPLSASLGDFITMILFLLSGYLFVVIGNHVNSFARIAIPIFIVIFFILFGAYCGYVAYNETSSKKVLKNGWLPIIVASAVSNVAGYILEDGKLDKKGMLLLQPLICGLLGNRVSVQCSRLSSSLHKSKVEYGKFPNNNSLYSFFNPLNTYFAGDFNSKIAISQIITSVPAQYMFASLSFLINETYHVKKVFYLYYALLFFFLMVVLMHVCNSFVHLIWMMKHDPDTVSIPILTSVTDVVSTFGLYILLSNIGDGIKYINPNQHGSGYCESNNTSTFSA